MNGSQVGSPERETQVSSEFAKMIASGKELEGHVDDLVQRLSTFLRQDNLLEKNSVMPPVAVDPQLVPHAEALRKQRYNIEGIMRKVCDVINRLEI